MGIDSKIDALLSEYERRCDAGESVSAQELCADAPELLPVIAPRVAALEASRRFFRTTTNGDAITPPARPTIPGYDILRPLGEGGMGIVYLARQIALNRLVALKTLRPSGMTTLALRQLRQEAHQLASLSHPNIVQIFDVGDVDGQPYFALEWLVGGSLADRLQDGPIDPRDAARFVLQLTGALEVTHRVGLIHCDLKPANILLTDDGTPKVVDFGLARRYEDEQRQTQTGVVRGTPSYMAPEQTTGQFREFAPTVDIYALGGILYELLTGRPPFLAATMLETLKQVQTMEPISPRRLNPAIPIDLETICQKCLEKSPANRYRSATELGDDLQRYLDDRPVYARRIGSIEMGWRWAKRNPSWAMLMIVCGLSAVAAIVGTVWVNRRLDVELQQVRAARDLAQQSVIDQAADRLDAELRELTMIPNLLARIIVSGEAIPPSLLQQIVENDPRIFGLCIAHHHESRFALLAQRQDSVVRLRRLDQEPGSDYRERDWYRFGVSNGRGWTPPYRGSDGAETLMVSYIVPIMRSNEFIGIIVLDLSIHALRSMQEQLRDLIPNVEERMEIESTTGEIILETNHRIMNTPCWQYSTIIPTTGWKLRVHIPTLEERTP